MSGLPRNAENGPDAEGVTWRGYLTLEEREGMIREAAYYRYLARGCCDGHDVEDWLLAEAEIDHGASEALSAILDQPIQQSSVHGPASDDKLKRAVRQHPRKAIPQVEGIDPADAPDRQ
ncbi:DUF2934 domain-containing protein [Betaproteobacteria bacterium SCN2]|jgi:hypothetical protein|nr:DUF2934 domain-containing protein [Betaproteobacteria bacterium SCN2]